MKKAPLFFAALTVLSACAHTQNGLSIIDDTQRVSQPAYTMDLHVPQVKNMTDAMTMTDINTKIHQIVDRTKTGFLSDIKDAEPIPGGPTQSTLDLDYDVVTATPQLLSIILRATPYTAGAAHPNHISLSFLYDIDTKKEIGLKDLFNTQTNYLDRLSQLSIAQLIETSKKNGTYYDGKEQEIGEGASAKEENFTTFSIQDDQLILTFDPYQVGPYAEGEQTVTLSRADITDVLSNEGRKLLSEGQTSVDTSAQKD